MPVQNDYNKYIMVRKIDIINLITEELKKINGIEDTRTAIPDNPYIYKKTVHKENVFSRFKFPTELNDFPAICLMVGKETRSHIGGGIKYGALEVTVRGYLHEDDTINQLDDFLDDIEHIMNGISYVENQCAKEIVDCRIISVGSDDGLMEPMGVCEIICELTYECN
jgi:hypothetical protein